MNAEALTLFDITPTGAVAPRSDGVRCLWHRGEAPAASHRVVSAVDLMNPWWWQWGGLRADGALTACNGQPLRLHTVGAGYCPDCVDRNAGTGLKDRGTVTHFAPITAA